MPGTRTIADVMTTIVVTVSADMPLRRAQAMMQADRIRHLPVVDAAGTLVGIVNERELAVLRGFGFGDDDALTVADAMATPPYAVRPDTPLRQVVGRMRDERTGSAVVVDGGRVVGIFTLVDALELLERTL